MTKEKIVSIEDRIPKLKQARKKKANRRLIFYLSIFFFLISIIVYLQSPLSHVKSIIVNGNSFYEDEELINRSGLHQNTNIWTIKKEEIVQALEEVPIIDTVEIETKLPSTVAIHITEHKRIGYIKKGQAYYPILANGSLFTESSKEYLDGDAPLLVNFTDEEKLIEISKELSKLPKGIFNIISELHWNPTEKNQNTITLYMSDGNMVESSIRDFSEKMTVYPSIAAQLDPSKEGIIHIGIGAYFKPFNEEMTEEELEASYNQENEDIE
ncbi:cell division protein FtsQ/DivIB [Ornithinibacillus halotolerans]|uniref:Cell division protein DivIB n=1 Tax=Ornithinibacillus halotolerans TaxID=1274357 RepID=A0A916S6V3_9BACI|nr:FtsQ-type POTRA domain-containing protein [Ornithinibacillus halotolerans]GGA83935.1 cell division protein DivIB [Ornithinibacillus halotolerans]